MDPAALKLSLLLAAGLGGGLWIFFSAFTRLRLRRAVAGTPTSKARSAAMGKCELKGIAREIDLPVLGPLSGSPCVWYRWMVEEERRDTKGAVHWAVVEDRHSVEPFELEDISGRVRVNPEGAEVEAPKLLSYTPGLFSSAPRPQGPQAAGWLDFGRRRLSEWRIEAARPVYVLGYLHTDASEASPQPVLGLGRQGEPFFISTRSEDEVLSELFWAVWGRMLLGAGLSIACLLGAAKIFLKL